MEKLAIAKWEIRFELKFQFDESFDRNGINNLQEWRHSIMVVASIKYPPQRVHIRCGFISRTATFCGNILPTVDKSQNIIDSKKVQRCKDDYCFCKICLQLNRNCDNEPASTHLFSFIAVMILYFTGKFVNR